MVLTDESKLVSRLIAAWSARREELRELIAMDPTNNAAWLWAIQLRILTYLLRRYGREHKRDLNPIEETKRSVTALRSSGTIHATKTAHSYDECEHRARFRQRCHETLVRLQSLVANARTRSLLDADAQVKLACERRCRSRWKRSGLLVPGKVIAAVAIFLFVLLSIMMVLHTLE